jgi:phosphohistidine phosphatase
MARWLTSRLGDSLRAPSQWRVVASPAVRAQQTAAALEMPLETISSLAPDASPDAVLRAADWPANSRSVIVVGHQPTLGMVAARLINGVDGYVAVKKGAIWWFRNSAHHAENVGAKAVLVAMVTPETVKE